ncbi:TolC family protein [Flavilitoribacter nigricans]|uniref:TolC family protein n=1 Tax=Flavilitoribacter nigricans (strain ATCC 23147 / DSM 23189 / NBRC 102662 / NCIMB 1420 / SS-2) TaxID=1122177 RepID=A0A2D0N570_FLAN2|nr:TolC family protein [Flavilitoribacter nigricans]PHN03530.1 hypothetical protein CRP01_26385 [Flavilitoribacter nigricans DSM 23189 = NBRC 102662]
MNKIANHKLPLSEWRLWGAGTAGDAVYSLIRRLGLGCLFLLPAFGLAGQPLDTLLAAIPENNPELKALELEYRAALQIAPQVSQLPDPDLKLGWFMLPPETRLGPQRFWWIFNQKLPWPGKLEAQKDLALARAAPLLEKVAARKLVLEQNLRKSWLELYRLNKLQEVIEEQLEIYESLEEVALAKVENNRGGTVDVYRIQLQRNELQQKMTQLEIEKSKPQAEINRVLGRPSNAGVTITGFMGIPELPVNLEDLLTRITTDHPMLRILELQQEVSRQALAVSDLDSKPDFTVGLDYFLVGKRTDADPMGNGRDILMPHVMMTIPLNKGKYRAKEQEEALRIQALDQHQLDQLNAFRSMVEMALTNYRSAQSEIDFLDEQAYLLRTTLRVAQTDYANGKRSFEELLQLQEKLIGYKERHLASLIRMHIVMADLRFYLLF